MGYNIGKCLAMNQTADSLTAYVLAGLAGAKRGSMGKEAKCCTYKGWQVLPTDSDYY